MSWTCKSCNTLNSNLNTYCVYCKYRVGTLTPKENEDYWYDETDSLVVRVAIYQTKLTELGLSVKGKKQMPLTNEEINSNPNMSEKEKKFARWFALEKILIINMDDMMLRAHIEELQDIASEARARLTASDDEARERSAKNKTKRGFSASVATDDFTSNAIHNINERQKKMTKIEKEIERLVSMGIAREDAENMYKAATVVTIKHQGVEGVLQDNKVKNIVNSIVNATPEEKKMFSNPFVATSIAPASNVIITKIEEVEIKEEPVKSTFVSPFEKK